MDIRCWGKDQRLIAQWSLAIRAGLYCCVTCAGEAGKLLRVDEVPHLARVGAQWEETPEEWDFERAFREEHGREPEPGDYPPSRQSKGSKSGKSKSVPEVPDPAASPQEPYSSLSLQLGAVLGKSPADAGSPDAEDSKERTEQGGAVEPGARRERRRVKINDKTVE
jgi:hypothetical protein